MGIFNWSTTAANNTSVDGVDIAENCAAGNLNNGMRGMMRRLRLYFMDLAGFQAAKTGGTGSAFTVTTRSVIESGELASGIRLTLIPHANGLDNATLDADGRGVKQIQTVDGTNVVEGEIVANRPIDVIYRADFNSASGAWVLLNPKPLASSFNASDITNDSGVTGADVGAALDHLDNAKPETSRAVNTGTGLTGGGNLSADRTITADIASQAEAEAGTSASKLMTPQRTSQSIAAHASGAVPDAVIQEESAGNAGGSTAGSWVTRALNTVDYDPDSHVTLSSNQVTFDQDGWVEWSAPAYLANNHMTRLYNVTDGVVTAYGEAARCGSSDSVQTHSRGGCAAVASKSYRIEHRVTTAKAGDGLGVNAGFSVNNIYTRIRYWKV
ncbi:MAG: hypothetical protein ACE37E_01265 [Hyphomicrobiales bacterium]